MSPFPSERPQSPSSYFKPADGDNRVRILANPIEGWECWKEDGKSRKPVRARTKEELKGQYDPQDKQSRPKFFWALPIFSYEGGAVLVWEITQVSIMDALIALNKNKDWGSPLAYDITVTRSGKNLDTEYSVLPSPKTEFGQAITDAWLPIAATFNIEALFENGNPFGDSAGPDDGVGGNDDDIPF